MSDPTRRLAIAGGLVAATGLNPPPLNRPPAGPLNLGVQPGRSSGVIVGNVVLVFGPTGAAVGVFVYPTGSTPGPGVAPIAWITNQIQDPFGNIVLPQIGAASGTNIAAMAGGVFELQNAGHLVGKLSFTGGAAFYLQAFGGFSTLTSDPLSAVLPGSSPVAPETFHAPTTTGFTTVAGDQPVEYRLTPDNMVEITGIMTATGAYTSGTTIWTMPAAYTPNANAVVGVQILTGVNITSGWANIGSNSIVQLPFAVANAALVLFTGGRYRLT